MGERALERLLVTQSRRLQIAVHRRKEGAITVLDEASNLMVGDKRGTWPLRDVGEPIGL